MACEVALEASEGLDAALAFGFLALQVFAGGGVAASPCDRDDVQRPVDLPVPASTAASAWVLLWVSAPITIIQHVLSIVNPAETWGAVVRLDLGGQVAECGPECA